MKKIEGILFDLGDTLIDFGDVDVNRLFHAGGRLAYDYLKSLGQPVPSFFRYYIRQLASVYWHNVHSHFTGREFNSLEVMTRLGGKWGQKLSPQQEIELAWKWYQPLREIATIENDLPATLASLKDMGLTLGIISNTFVPGQILDIHLQQEGMIDLFPTRIYSCDTGCRKPNPEIFRIALEKTSLDPEKTLFIGDSPKADIIGSAKSGLTPVLKDPKNKYRNRKLPTRHRISKISELIEIVNSLNA